MSKPKKPKHCFIVGPIGDPGTPTRDNADMLADYVIGPVVEPMGYKLERADRIAKPGTITDQIIELVLSADLVVADLTAHNANAFYELALSHMAARPTIHLITKGERIPFDIADARTIHYELRNPTLIKSAGDELRKQVEEVEKAGYEPSNPVTRARGMQRLVKSGDSTEQLIRGLSDTVRVLTDRVREVEQRSTQALAASQLLSATTHASGMIGATSPEILHRYTLARGDEALNALLARSLLRDRAADNPPKAATTPKSKELESGTDEDKSAD